LRIRVDLRKLGLADDVVEDGVGAYGDWVAQKKFGAKLPTDYADRQRQARFLDYRGFTGAQIRLALGFDTDIDVDM
jgi:regulatory protein